MTMPEIARENPTYSAMIGWCCPDGLILNNKLESLILDSDKLSLDPFCGNYYDPETEEFTEYYQQFIISERDANTLKTYTNELVLVCEDLDLYLLCVTHYGTPWNGVSANWKTDDEES